jgi:hypothetical protein
MKVDEDPVAHGDPGVARRISVDDSPRERAAARQYFDDLDRCRALRLGAALVA